MSIHKEYIFLNGEIVASENALLHVSDLSILRGYGVFDYFRVIDKKAIFIDDHIERFFNSCRLMNLVPSLDAQDLKSGIDSLIKRSEDSLIGIKIILTGGYSDDGYTPTTGNLIMIPKPFSFHPYEQGLSLHIVDHQRELYQVKSINYLTPISLLPTLQNYRADDVLYHRNGYITESSRSNFFMVKNKVLITPDDFILEGITRKKIIGFAEEIMALEIRPILINEISSADEVFLTASTKRVSPVTKIDDYTYKTGTFTKKIYERLLEEEKK